MNNDKKRPALLPVISYLNRLPPTLLYTLLGGMFGLTFPIIAIFINALQMGLPIDASVLAAVHRRSIIQWLVDTAPFVLAAFAYLAGRRQQQVLDLNQRQTRFIGDRDRLITQLQTAIAQREEQAQRSLAQLRTAAQIARQSTSLSAQAPAATLNELLAQTLNQTTHLISEQFGYYHVGIFISEAELSGEAVSKAPLSSDSIAKSQSSDFHSKYTTLVASNSPGGQHMLKRGHKLKIGGPGTGTGIVGYVAAEGKPKIALDVGAEAVYFDNPDLPDTRSEMALPLIIAGKTIGVLDVQSTQSAAFGERDVAVMSLIAESLAGAIENARLIQQLRSSLESVRQLHQQYLQKAWGETLSLEKTLLYTSTPAVAAETDNTNAEQNLHIPIKLRDQIIGEISLQGRVEHQAGDAAAAPANAPEWLPEEIGLAQAIADQTAQALENARLLAETQRRAERERITASIAGKVWSFSDIDTILQTALQELGQSLDATEGFIQLTSGELDSPPVEMLASDTEAEEGEAGGN